MSRSAAEEPEVTTTRSYDFRTARRAHHIVNTDRLLYSRYEILGGKTGFINEAGYCFATMVETPSGTEVTAVLLGAPSNRLRFAEARRLLDWTFRFGLPRASAAAGTE